MLLPLCRAESCPWHCAALTRLVFQSSGFYELMQDDMQL